MIAYLRWRYRRPRLAPHATYAARYALWLEQRPRRAR